MSLKDVIDGESPQAIGADIDALRREKTLLLNEVDTLRAETEYLLALHGREAIAGFNRRSFERALDREVARASREADARFSIVRLTLGEVPGWFPGFILQLVRICDICARTDRHEFALFLHGAGGLGRRLFLRRFSKALEAAEGHHQNGARVRVEAGGATYPTDAETPKELFDAAADDRRLLPREADKNRRPAPSRRSPRRTQSRTDLVLSVPPNGVPARPAPRRPDPREVLSAIEDACDQQASGEVVVRSQEVVGRVYIHRGRLAWAHCTSRNMSLAEFLITEWGADADDVRFAFTHCRQSGGNFAETLIEFGMLERDEMRSVLECHIRAHLEAVRELPQPDVLFLPQSRVYNSDLLFDLDEVVSDERPASEVIIEALRKKRANGRTTSGKIRADIAERVRSKS